MPMLSHVASSPDPTVLNPQRGAAAAAEHPTEVEAVLPGSARTTQEEPRRLGSSAERAFLEPVRTPAIDAKVVHGVIDPVDAQEFREAFHAGQSIICCGHWRTPAASRLQQRIASELGIPIRRLGDVHLSNTSSRIVSSTTPKGLWGAVAVVYLESPGTPRASLRNLDGTVTSHIENATALSLVVIPEGGQLVHSTPHAVAWLHFRRHGVSDRSVFDYYFVAWARANFVAPYDTERQRKLFSSFTKFPRFWHGFLWSFIGMLLTMFACLPLAWRAIQAMDRMYFQESRRKQEPIAPPMPEEEMQNLPTLIKRDRRSPSFMKYDTLMKPNCKGSQSLREQMV
eukprot:CAMPEP_0115271870 /NCGR_PEP_ID=MMETSP0270-20121206/54329_1 /TAXON_ID=71861 /ORGANISM="Scrippsiella trochoidea, Strain CCMP3099" /LENGTH=340 /DNA_ID=CAMNT_0002688257 /DNA_START=119 /DNA_END=1141 /DNA_ORIENTATION=+